MSDELPFKIVPHSDDPVDVKIAEHMTAILCDLKVRAEFERSRATLTQWLLDRMLHGVDSKSQNGES